MKKTYKVTFEGFYLVKADSPEDAKELAESGYDFYAETSIVEVEECDREY